MEFFEMTDEDVNIICIKHKYDCLNIILMFSGVYTFTSRFSKRLFKNSILINLFEENDNTIKVVFDYWNSEIDRWKEYRSSTFVEGTKFLNEIMEDYYRSVITDNWANEVGEKYYY